MVNGKRCLATSGERHFADHVQTFDVARTRPLHLIHPDLSCLLRGLRSLRQKSLRPVSSKCLSSASPPENHGELEERLSHYADSKYFNVRIGDTLNSRYNVLGKPGYSSSSTVWLSKDMKSKTYAAVKVYPATPPDFPNPEVIIHEKIIAIQTEHHGKRLIRTVLDSLTLQGEPGTHHCQVQASLWMTISKVQMLLPNETLPIELARQLMI